MPSPAPLRALASGANELPLFATTAVEPADGDASFDFGANTSELPEAPGPEDIESGISGFLNHTALSTSAEDRGGDDLRETVSAPTMDAPRPSGPRCSCSRSPRASSAPAPPQPKPSAASRSSRTRTPRPGSPPTIPTRGSIRPGPRTAAPRTAAAAASPERQRRELPPASRSDPGSRSSSTATAPPAPSAQLSPQSGSERQTRWPARILQLLPLISCVLICIVGLVLCYQAYDPGFLGIRSKVLGNF